MPSSARKPHIPEDKRSWSTPWPDYAPIDITPSELQPANIAEHLAEKWVLDSGTVDDVPAWIWEHRRAQAFIPFDLDPDTGRPLNPNGRTGRTGRDLGAWGENRAVDPIVIAGTGEGRSILLIRRSDTKQWAFPGGMVDHEEEPANALAREAREETGIHLHGLVPDTFATRYVDDPRNTDHAWICTLAALYRTTYRVPVKAGSDALEARWWSLPDVDTLLTELDSVGGLYPAHHAILREAFVKLEALEQETDEDDQAPDVVDSAREILTAVKEFNHVFGHGMPAEHIGRKLACQEVSALVGVLQSPKWRSAWIEAHLEACDNPETCTAS